MFPFFNPKLKSCFWWAARRIKEENRWHRLDNDRWDKETWINIFEENKRERFSLVHESKSLETKSNQIEETFWNPNLLIQSIQELQQK